MEKKEKENKVLLFFFDFLDLLFCFLKFKFELFDIYIELFFSNRFRYVENGIKLIL